MGGAFFYNAFQFCGASYDTNGKCICEHDREVEIRTADTSSNEALRDGNTDVMAVSVLICMYSFRHHEESRSMRHLMDLCQCDLRLNSNRHAGHGSCNLLAALQGSYKGARVTRLPILNSSEPRQVSICFSYRCARFTRTPIGVLQLFFSPLLTFAPFRIAPSA